MVTFVAKMFLYKFMFSLYCGLLEGRAYRLRKNTPESYNVHMQSSTLKLRFSPCQQIGRKKCILDAMYVLGEASAWMVQTEPLQDCYVRAGDCTIDAVYELSTWPALIQWREFFPLVGQSLLKLTKYLITGEEKLYV